MPEGTLRAYNALMASFGGTNGETYDSPAPPESAQQPRFYTGRYGRVGSSGSIVFDLGLQIANHVMQNDADPREQIVIVTVVIPDIRIRRGLSARSAPRL